MRMATSSPLESVKFERISDLMDWSSGKKHKEVEFTLFYIESNKISKFVRLCYLNKTHYYEGEYIRKESTNLQTEMEQSGTVHTILIPLRCKLENGTACYAISDTCSLATNGTKSQENFQLRSLLMIQSNVFLSLSLSFFFNIHFPKFGIKLSQFTIHYFIQCLIKLLNSILFHSYKHQFNLNTKKSPIGRQSSLFSSFACFSLPFSVPYPLAFS